MTPEAAQARLEFVWRTEGELAAQLLEWPLGTPCCDCKTSGAVLVRVYEDKPPALVCSLCASIRLSTENTKGAFGPGRPHSVAARARSIILRFDVPER